VNVNQGARQWPTNLIGYDALTSYGSPSYYVQKMYRDFHGDRILPVDVKVERRPSETAAAPQDTTPRGRVGVGTWATRAEFKDMKVTSGDEVLYAVQPDNTADWRLGAGDWKWDGETLRQQNAEETNCRALAGSRDWTDYTFTLKARKISGAEGFLILFHVQNDNSWLWWNVGGWGNSRTAIQKSEPGGDREIGRTQDVTVEAGRWYDVKIEVHGRQIRCYLDGDLKVERTDPVTPAQPPPAAVYATALRDTATGDVVMRVINTELTPRAIKINLEGVKSVGKDAQIEVLRGDPTDVNTVDDPTKLSPKKMLIDNASANFTHLFPPHSLTVFRLKAQ
jgi:alpha-L-arabinofuranosidase